MMTDDTTALSYWLNWRFFLCALWVFIAMVAATILIIKYEVFHKNRSGKGDECDVEPSGILYSDETWRTSLKVIHPAWLLAYRLIAFGILLALLISNLVIAGAGKFFFYTQWTFALVTFNFGLACSFSICGLYQYWNEVGDDNISHVGLDAERGTYVAPSIEASLVPEDMPMRPHSHGEFYVRKPAGIWGYLFQIVFQMSAGAVGLTDSVFWFIIYPFFMPATYKLNFLNVSMHSLNAVLLLIDMILNRLRFPFFRLAYFALWTCIFIIFQLILHACVSMRWPYSFLDLSSPYAPIWYFGVGLIHLPAYGIFALLVKGKQYLLSTLSQDIRSIR